MKYLAALALAAAAFGQPAPPDIETQLKKFVDAFAKIEANAADCCPPLRGMHLPAKLPQSYPLQNSRVCVLMLTNRR